MRRYRKLANVGISRHDSLTPYVSNPFREQTLPLVSSRVSFFVPKAQTSVMRNNRQSKSQYPTDFYSRSFQTGRGLSTTNELGLREEENRLFYLVENNHVNELRNHLRASENSIEVRDGYGRTLLHIAVRNSCFEVAKLLLDEGAFLERNEKKNNATALHWACAFCNDVKILQLLLDNGADINARTNRGHTPLILAAIHGRFEFITEILERKPEISRNREGCDALTVAVRFQRLKVVSLLLKDGRAKYFDLEKALRESCRQNSLDIMNIILKYHPDVNKKNDLGNSPLYLSIQALNKEMVEMLLAKGANINERDRDGDTLLHQFLKQGKSRNTLKFLQLLCNFGASLEAKNKEGYSPIEVARAIGFFEALNIFESYRRKTYLKGLAGIISNTKKSIFLSYTWLENIETVNEVDNDFKELGIRLIRDRRDNLGYGSVRRFISDNMRLNYVIAIISDKYLKSINCVFEIMEMRKDTDYRSRFFPIVLDDKIYKVGSELEYIKYWQKEKERLERNINEMPMESTAASVRELNQICNIINNIGEFMDELRDITSVSLKSLKKYSYYQILEKIIVSEPDKMVRTTNLGVERSHGDTTPNVMEEDSNIIDENNTECNDLHFRS